MRILLVEDDPLIGHGVSQSLIEANHTCHWVKDGKAVITALDGDTFDAVLLDLGLPGMDGTSVLRQLRERGKNIPVIIITARDGVQDRIQGLDLGADDYLVKPFSLGELQARLRAVARRHVGTGSPQLATALLQLDPATAVATGESGDVSLSARELALLQALMYRPGQVFSREQLESHVYSQGEEVASNAIEVVIHGLRKKLGKQSIRNIRGLGWMVDKVKHVSLQRELNRWLFVASLACAVAGGLLSAGLAYLSAEDMQDSMLLEVARWVPDGEDQDNFWRRERHDEQVLVQTLGKRGYLKLSEKLKPGFHDIEARGNFWRVLVVRPKDGDDAYAVAQQTELRAELAGKNALYALLPVVLLAIGFFLVARWVLARGLKPVRKLAADVDSREALSLEPLNDAGIAEEILPFTRAINRLLGRTRNDIQRQQRFIADAAHEMRTPVAGLNILAESVCRDQTQENQVLMRQGLKRLESLVTQLLDLARMQFNYQTHTQVVDADGLLRELIASVYPLAMERSVDLGVLRIENVRVEDLDHGLSKIFRNGLSNAIRYIPVDGQINVSLFADARDMVFRVDDNGPGIDPAALKSVFEPFDRGSRAGNEGNGLGLAIARQAAVKAGGLLTVENLEGRGLRYEYRQHRVAVVPSLS